MYFVFLSVALGCWWFCLIFVSLAFFVFVSTKIIKRGGLKYLYLRAGLLGAIYGLVAAFILGYLGGLNLPFQQVVCLNSAPEIVRTQALQLTREANRLTIELSLLQNGLDFAIKGSIFVIGITYAIRRILGLRRFNAIHRQATIRTVVIAGISRV